MSDGVDELAGRIAERGRETLLARLRPAFQEAARSYADVLELDEDQLEQMAQRAADRADGLQWRRALATVASEELGIGLGEALAHPAVARAQQLVGAPSYEDSLARLEAGSLGPDLDTPEPSESEAAAEDDVAGPEAEAEEEVEPEEAEPGVPEPLTAAGAAPGAAEPAESDAGLRDAPGPDTLESEAVAAAPEGEDEPPQILRLPAIHLSGIASLGAPERGLELRLGDFGVDIARKPGRVIGRLRWPDIEGLEVPQPRGLRRRRRQGQTQLVVHTPHGDASFEIPEIPADELRSELMAVEARYLQS